MSIPLERWRLQLMRQILFVNGLIVVLRKALAQEALAFKLTSI